MRRNESKNFETTLLCIEKTFAQKFVGINCESKRKRANFFIDSYLIRENILLLTDHNSENL
jgi:hypothetical protein